MTSIEPRTPIFPEHPEDGFVVIEYLDDGRELHWTYNKTLNQWAAHFVYPENPATEGWVQGQGYVKGPVRTRDVLTTDPRVKDGSTIKTQEQVNNLIAGVAESAVKAGGRTTDQVDFLQNAIGKGTWNHSFYGVGFPQTGEFWTKDNVSEFSELTGIIINDIGGSPEGSNDPGSLKYTRVGDYLTIQERGTNDFGMYVVVATAFQVINDITIREFGLKLFANRSSGSTQVNSSRCQITTSRPVYTVVQDEEPKVSSRGVLWYRETDNVLSISNYETGFTGIGPQWTEINGGSGSGGSSVHVGENPPADAKEGDEWFDSTRLELFVYYVDGNGVSGWVPCSPLGARVEAGEQRQQALIGTVGVIQDDYLSKSQGGVVTGAVDIRRDSGTSLIVRKGEAIKFDVAAGGRVRCLYDLSLDDDDTTVVTRGWVKQQLGSSDEGGNGGSESLGWAPSKFKFKEDGTIQNINPGDFYISNKGEGERNIVLHHSAADGVDWTFREPNVDWEQTFNGPCCIRKIDGTIVFQGEMVSMTCYGVPNDRKHVTVKTKNSRRLDLTNGEEYVIHVPGILPRFNLS